MKSVIVSVIAAFCLLQVSGQSEKQRLFRDLIEHQGYKPAIEPDNITLQMSVSLLCSWVEDNTGFVVSHGWEFYMWNDERLRWTPDEYGGVSMLRVPSKFVWTPDMMQFNTVTSDVERGNDVNAVVSSDGTVIWIPRVTYRAVCSENGTKLFCSMRIGSWTYDGNIVNLQVTEGYEALDLAYYYDACPLAVDSHRAEIVSKTYPCCEEPYPSMDIAVVYSRRRSSTSDTYTTARSVDY